ncbi:hypothetical protein B9Z19DRAFT_1094944 [Tuber borchii]|uniref:Uncharacterized protein n=1 Tax=Tuber borchii TaxID=42251 RepID=A0A2T6ZDI1_TUBBO|nr:hypothetical protein B9Z19DRAFT_1094944 [Tuber borchii]
MPDLISTVALVIQLIALLVSRVRLTQQLQATGDTILAENLGRKWENKDRVPEDLTLAPVHVDVVTVVLLCLAAGMKFSRYSPATSEITMSGKVGAITGPLHPVLGALHVSTVW